MDIGKIFSTKKCAVCGKEIIRASFAGYAYKRDAKVYCGWNCYRREASKGKEK